MPVPEITLVAVLEIEVVPSNTRVDPPDMLIAVTVPDMKVLLAALDVPVPDTVSVTAFMAAQLNAHALKRIPAVPVVLIL